jgi:arsenite oxidase small subunit
MEVSMDRRDFVEGCALGAGVLATTLGTGSWAAQATPRNYARVLLVDELGDPVKASQLQAQTNYVFHYPFEATPVFLLDLGKAAVPLSLKTKGQRDYQWPGGVGPRRSVVAFSAICAHQLVYPTKELSFISFRKGPVLNPKTPSHGNDLIHCCADHSQYDPARGAQVLGGPAERKRPAIPLLRAAA